MTAAKIEALRRDLRAARLEDYVKAAVDAAPPLTDQQRVRVAAILLTEPGVVA